MSYIDWPVITGMDTVINGKVFDVVAASKAARINTQKQVDKPPTCLAIRQGAQEIHALSLGDFSLVVGKAKSRKTALVSMITAALISGEYISDTIRGLLPDDKQGVLYIDTEQSEYHAIKSASRAMKLAGIEQSESFHPSMLREYSTEERKKICEYYINNTPNLGFVVIDGIRDLVKSVNNEDESKEMVDWVMRVSSQYYCHILCVIHENKTGGQIRGHLGTELQNKAQTVFGVFKPEEDSEVSIVSARESRDLPFKPFAIGYDPITQLPAVMHDYEINQKSRSFRKHNPPPKKKRLADYSFTEHSKHLKEIFDELGDRLRNSQLKEAVKDVYGEEFFKQDANGCSQYFINEGLLETNREESKDNRDKVYWLSEEAKKKASPF